MVDGDTGASAVGQFKTGTEKGLPLQYGEYDILQGTEGSYRLERRDGSYGDDVDGSTGQLYLRLHGPGQSFGCLTACSSDDWARVNSVISQTSTRGAVVNTYRDPLAKFGLGAYSGGGLRWKTGTERLKWYGTLKVTE